MRFNQYNRVFTSVLLLIIFNLVACGQTGPLYLPKPKCPPAITHPSKSPN